MLFIRLSNQSFGIIRCMNPPIVFAAQADVYVVRAGDGALLHFAAFQFQSKERRFTAWGENEASPFRSELKTAQRLFAEAIVQQLFDRRP